MEGGGVSNYYKKYNEKKLKNQIARKAEASLEEFSDSVDSS